MSEELLYLIASLAFWLAVVLTFRSIMLVTRLFFRAPGLNAMATQRGLALAAGGALLCGVLARVIPQNLGRPLEGDGALIPIAWVYMHFWGWMVVLSIFGMVSSLIQAYLGLGRSEQERLLGRAVMWFGCGLSCFGLFRLYGSTPVIFRGAFYLQPTIILVLVALVCLTMIVASALARQTKTRSAGKTLSIHLVLLAGCVVFGLPFAWLLSSSFKEDRDLGGGVMWIPKTTVRAPYFDPADRQFEGTFQGKAVLGSLIEEKGDIIKIDITRPFSMRGQTFESPKTELKEVPKQVVVVTGTAEGRPFKGKVIKELENGDRTVQFMEPADLKDSIQTFKATEVQELRPDGLRWQNYPEALQYLPPETNFGLVYLKNTVVLVILTVIGTILSCSIVAYGFSRLKFPLREPLFMALLSTMMLPGAVTLMPQFLIFKQFGWIDTLHPLWVPSFFAGAFNVFMLRQFFSQIPMELEDAAKIDGCSYLKSFWAVMLPQVKPALAVVAIWTIMGTWNNFMGPLIYVSSPENMPIAYALQLFNGERGGEPGLLMAFATMTMLPILALFFFAQRYFIEGVTLSGLGGR